MEKYYLDETKQGFKIAEWYTDKRAPYGLIVLVKRPRDWAVGWGYDMRDGRWAQGYYDFEKADEAREFIYDKWMGAVLTSKDAIEEQVKNYGAPRLATMKKGGAELSRNKSRMMKRRNADYEGKVVFDEVDEEDSLQWDVSDWYFDDDALYGDDYTDGIIIMGNRWFDGRIYSRNHEKEIREILNYYDDSEVLKKKKKVTGKEYSSRDIKGYSQSDWNVLYYPVGEFSEERLDEIEDAYFGKYDIYRNRDDEDEWVIVFHSDNRPVKKIISEQTGYPESDIVVRMISGYTRTPNYVEASVVKRNRRRYK